MANNAYKRSATRERRVVNDYRRMGWLAARSAGSKSPVDVWAVNPHTGETRLVQIKTKKNGRTLARRLVWSKGNTEFWWYEYK